MRRPSYTLSLLLHAGSEQGQEDCRQGRPCSRPPLCLQGISRWQLRILLPPWGGLSRGKRVAGKGFPAATRTACGGLFACKDFQGGSCASPSSHATPHHPCSRHEPADKSAVRPAHVALSRPSCLAGHAWRAGGRATLVRCPAPPSAPPRTHCRAHCRRPHTRTAARTAAAPTRTHQKRAAWLTLALGPRRWARA